MSTPPEPRYAIYFVPEADTPLYRFGASVLGYDCYTGRDIAFLTGTEADSWAEIVRDARIYGFHATLKPPFRLAEGFSEGDLDRAVLDFAADMPAVLAGELAVRALGNFIAVVPKTSHPQLDRWANACVRDFERFRAPMTEQDRARRLVPGLNARQIENIERWGYPYVFDDFRFHMTLSGSLAPAECARVLRLLCDKYEQLPGTQPVTVDRIVLTKQCDKSTPFRVIRQASLGQSPCRPYAYSY